jgi:hypothetical protein
MNPSVKRRLSVKQTRGAQKIVVNKDRLIENIAKNLDTTNDYPKRIKRIQNYESVQTNVNNSSVKQQIKNSLQQTKKQISQNQNACLQAVGKAPGFLVPKLTEQYAYQVSVNGHDRNTQIVMDRLDTCLNDFKGGNTWRERLNVVYASFEVARLVISVNPQLLDDYLSSPFYHGNLSERNFKKPDIIPPTTHKKLVNLLTNWDEGTKEEARQNIHNFFKGIQKRYQRVTRSDCQMTYLPSISFAVGKYLGTCMDTLLKNYVFEGGQPYINGTHYNLSKQKKDPDPKRSFVFLVTMPMFRHFHSKDNTMRIKLKTILEHLLAQTPNNNPRQTELRRIRIIART